MANLTSGFFQVDYKREFKERWERVNFILRQIQGRTDALEGGRGQTVHQGDININGFTIINLKTPVNPTDAANKQYVDDQIASVLISAASAVNPLDYLAL